MEESMIDKMELQLHEQFAQNYNNTFSTTVTLFCTMVATLYGYGFVFLHSSARFASEVGKMEDGCAYTLDALIFVTIASLVVLTIMQCICIALGGGQRLEQFVVYAIRERHLRRRKRWGQGVQMFPFEYSPIKRMNRKNKGIVRKWERLKKCHDIIVGIYGEFILLIFFLQLFVLVGLAWKCIANIMAYDGFNRQGFLEYVLFIIAVVGCCLLYLVW